MKTIEPLGTVRCRYCQRNLFPAAGRWVDGDGIAVCMRYDGELPAGESDGFYHAPDRGN